MKVTGWSWDEYMNTPADVIVKYMTLHNVSTVIQGGGALTFAEDKEGGCCS